MSVIYKTVQTKLDLSDFEKDYFEAQCKQANNLYNSAVYLLRQNYFAKAEKKGYFFGDEYRHGYRSEYAKCEYNGPEGLAATFKTNKHYIALGGQCAQQVLKSVDEAFTSYNKLLSKAFKGDLHFWPKLPQYRKSGGLYTLSFNPSAVRYDGENGFWKLPVSRDNATELKDLGQEIWVKGPFFERLSEIRILPRNNEFYAEFVYQAPSVETKLDPQRFISIDPGLNNAMTVVSNIGRSFIVDGKKQKFWNHFYNKTVAKIKSGKAQDYWDDELARLTEQRNRRLRDFRNKAARFVINFCLENNIGTLVFGWNTGMKQGVNMGKRNNQNFVQAPLSRLKNRIKELCNEYGINFVETEESYTSKASFLDNDELFEYGEKPNEWKPSGTRTRRGLYKTQDGSRINADGNGAANIARKVSTRLSLDLSGVCKGILTAPKRYDVFQCMDASYRKQSEDKALQPLS